MKTGMGGGFEGMEPIFGQVKPEDGWSKDFLFHIHSMQNDPFALAVRLTDFHSSTWQALKSRQQLEDMRDTIGIGGSWSEFVDYVIASFKSEDVKLVLEGQSKPGGAPNAKLIAQKAKGMPRIYICLTKLEDIAASETMSNISKELLKALKQTHDLLTKEQEHCCQVTKILAAEQEKSASIQRQLDTLQFSQRQKLQWTSDKSISDVMRGSSDKQSTQTTASTKTSNRFVPAHRRTKARGFLLQDTEDEQDQ